MGAKRNQVVKAFGVVLREARLESRMTQEQLAAASGTLQHYVSMIETATHQPSIDVLMRLERALELPPGELIRRTDAWLKSDNAFKRR